MDQAPPPHEHQHSTVESVRMMSGLIWHPAAVPKGLLSSSPVSLHVFSSCPLRSPVASAWDASPFSPRLPPLCILKPLLVFSLSSCPTHTMPASFLSFSGTKPSAGHPSERKKGERRQRPDAEPLKCLQAVWRASARCPLPQLVSQSRGARAVVGGSEGSVPAPGPGSASRCGACVK